MFALAQKKKRMNENFGWGIPSHHGLTLKKKRSRLRPETHAIMHQPFPRGACRGISVLWAGGQGFFFPGHMDGGLVLDWQSLVCPFVFQSFLGCVPFWHRSRKFQVVISSWCNFLKSIKFPFFQKKMNENFRWGIPSHQGLTLKKRGHGPETHATMHPNIGLQTHRWGRT